MDIFAPFEIIATQLSLLMGLSAGTHQYDIVHYWIYDMLKISVLLLLISFFMAVMRYYLPMERVRNLLSSKRLYGTQYLMAGILGMVTPFCSCSSIPLFVGFLSAGIPLGITFTFLISSPLVNESSLFLFPSIFGWKIAILYNLIGLGISIVGGLCIQRLHMERYIQPEIIAFTGKQQLIEKFKGQYIPWGERIHLWISEMWDFVKKVYLYVVLGVTLGALIHGFVPEGIVTSNLLTKGWLSVPLAVLLGVPLYANSVSIIPIIHALIEKGIPLGTALAFMTATVTLSIPEALMLKKVLKWQLLAMFFGITIVGIMLMGFVFNLI